MTYCGQEGGTFKKKDRAQSGYVLLWFHLVRGRAERRALASLDNCPWLDTAAFVACVLNRKEPSVGGVVGHLNFESLSNAVELCCPRELVTHNQHVFLRLLSHKAVATS